jgi:hypothetical protein
LNCKTVPHVGFLPDLEATVEGLAALRFKSKLDMRSRFWQVELTLRAQELTAFILPNGRVYKWRVMPFGLSNAPGVFQELMNKVIDDFRRRPKAKELLEQGCVVAAFFDDVGIGTHTLEQHHEILREFFEVARQDHLRIKLSKCEFMKESLEYLGYQLENGWWKPSTKKIEALQRVQVKDLKSLQRFLGALNFYRRHIPRFSFTSAILTDLTKKGVPFKWTDEHQSAFETLKAKLADVRNLGVPNSDGEILIVTDASDVGGGASLYQWQKLSKDKTESFGAVIGVNRDGTLKHTHTESEVLVPLGHFNWKWSPARQNYATYEQELLGGVLGIASQRRILSHLPIVWLCDQAAVSYFVRGNPPENARLKRWWVFLSQFRLHIHHIPGAKNELCDMLSRDNFCELFQADSEDLARQAFQRMDIQLDLRMEALEQMKDLCAQDYQEEYPQVWGRIQPHSATLIDGTMFYRDENKLWNERKLVLPKGKLPDTIVWCHTINGHPGIERTTWFLKSNFHVDLTLKDLMEEVRKTILSCRICAEAKPNSAKDRGLVGALPIPSMVNEILYVDFISMDEYAGKDYILTIVCGLSRFAQFIPCRKRIDAEGVLELVFREWIQKFGRPKEIFSDNDVRFVSERGFWQSALKAMKVKVNFSTPRRPENNGLCERMNRSFVQNMRCLMASQKSKDWIRLVPLCTWMMNNQVHSSTQLCPAELFFGRPAWQPDLVPELMPTQMSNPGSPTNFSSRVRCPTAESSQRKGASEKQPWKVNRCLSSQ